MTKNWYFCRSLRKDSFNKLVAKTMADLFPADFEPVFINIGDLELYNQDLDDEGTPTEAWTTFREEVKQVDGVMFVTPEYNRSVPAVLKMHWMSVHVRMAKAFGIKTRTCGECFTRCN